ncbi:Hsp20/alpha crystallin family protein [Nitrosovibrio tenuis]|uniref:HSP20 family protein n=1 Tax=Nitrosovibrio tenuis TaxID=1233 RepID=A0A1H7I6D5_9PROT|nr:Hsp20/alpha crystallin family protein [Nitrosovibrio tenuis]SEK56125.1 HSP20 family protein [Nitrosovibrio tenuis]
MANIARRSPLGEIARFDPFYNIDDWFKGFGMRPFSMDVETPHQIKIDVSETDTAYKVRAELPGVKKEDVKVQVEGNRVTIGYETKQEKEEKEGERVIYRESGQGASYRTFTLGSEVDETKAEAKYENGTLELTLPKKEGKTAKRIEVK